MGFLKPKKDLVVKSGGTASGPSKLTSNERPKWSPKGAPCVAACPAGNDVRGILVALGQREKFGRSLEEAYAEAWRLLAQSNPFPSTGSRICSHSCESACNRSAIEGGIVAMHDVERFLGDKALAENWPLPSPAAEKRDEKIAVIGGGPIGLSCAYFLACGGYQVTVFETGTQPRGWNARDQATDFPFEIRDSEIQRILDLGVELHLDATDADLDKIPSTYNAVFRCVALEQTAQLAFGVEGASSEQLDMEPDGFAIAVGFGHKVADTIHERITGAAPAGAPKLPVIDVKSMNLSYFRKGAEKPAEEQSTSAAGVAAAIAVETAISPEEERVLAEAARCMSCGQCILCGRCWMYCQEGAIVKPAKQGEPYSFKLEFCIGCKKCGNICPCGYIEMSL